MFNGPAKKHIINFPRSRLAFATILFPFGCCHCIFKILLATNGINRRLLSNETSINQALKINKPIFFKLSKPVNTGHFDNP